MKKTLIIGSVMALTALVGAQAVQAQTTTRAEIKSDLKAGIKQKRVELKAHIEEKRQEIKTERASTTAEIKTMKLNETIKSSGEHLTKELSRLNDAKTRISSRLAKFDAAGANTVAAKADLAIAVTNITTAQAKVDAVASVQAGTSTKAFAEALRTAVKTAQSAINDAQKALQKVTSDMRGLEASIKMNKNASSTNATSTRN